MDDPLAVERDELLQIIGELERLCAGLRDVNAGVSISWIRELQRLRRQVEEARSPTKLKMAWPVAQELLKAIAAELIKWLIETLNCSFAAIGSRRCLYESRRMHQILTRRRWSHAA